MKALTLIQPCAVLLLAGLLPRQTYAAPQSAGGQAATKPGATKPAVLPPNTVQIGDLTISKQKSVTYAPSKPIEFFGPDIRVETTDKKRALHILVFTDHIDAQKASASGAYADLTGNVRYTITEQIKVGERTLQRVINGTARRARYTQSDKTLRILDDVHATLIDPTRFDGPAVLSVGSLVVPGEGRYNLAGNAALNDIRFTPLPPTPLKETKDGKKPRAAFQPGMVHAHGFATGSIDIGNEARFDGPLVVIESDNPQTKNRNVFKAPHFLAGLEKDKDSIAATGGVTFDCRQTDAKGNTQTLSGTAGQVLSQHGQPLVLEGGVNASLTDAASLKEPATLIATRVTAILGNAPRFVVAGLPQHTRLSFAPRTASALGAGAASDKPAPPASGVNTRPADTAALPPANGATDAANLPVINAAPIEEADTQTPAPAANATASKKTPFVIGDIVVTDFATATYIPDKSLVVDGPRVHFVSSDAATKNDAELHTPHLEADLAVELVKDKNGMERKVTSLREARATKGAEFKFQQPLKDGSSQTLAGTGGTMTFSNKSAQSQVVKVLELATLRVASPEVGTQGTEMGTQGTGDTLTYDLITQVWTLDTPQKTFVARADFAKAPSQPADATNGATKKTTKKKRK